MGTYDISQAIRTMCINDSPLNANVGGRVFYPNLPDDEKIFPCVSFNILSGETDLYLPISKPIVEFKCWADEGEGHDVARDTYNLLHTALHGKNNVAVGSTKVLWCHNSSEGQGLIEPAAKYKFVRSLFQFGILIE